MVKISGNVYAITGAASGIGLACAKALVAEEAKVVLIDRDEKGLHNICQELGERALSLVVDLMNPEEVNLLLEKILALTDGRLDGFHANAGSYVGGLFEEGDADAWDRMLNLNVNAVFRSIKAVLPHFIAQKGGDILVTSSIAGLMPVVAEPIYTASKNAVHAFVRALRVQLTPHSIRVGAIAPGPVRTPLILNDWPKEKRDEIIENGCMMEAEDIAEAMVFMLTRRAKVTIREITILSSSSKL